MKKFTDAPTIIGNATGLRIKPVNRPEFIEYGDVAVQAFPEDGVIYYCGGFSYPEEIVAGIYFGDEIVEEFGLNV